MKASSLFFLLVFTSQAWCDTIDHWSISRNDVVLARFNMYSADLSINIPAASLGENDYLSFSYFSCAKYVDNHKQLLFRGVHKSKVVLAESKDNNPLRLNLLALYRIASVFKMDELQLFFINHVRSYGDNNLVPVAIISFI